MITNAHIIALVNQKDIQNITVHTIPVEHSYKVVKFKQRFNKILKEYQDTRELLVKEAGVESEREFNERKTDLKNIKNRTEEQETEYQEALKKEKEINGLTSKLLSDEVSFEGVKALPYQVWKALQDENKGTDKKPEALSGLISVVTSVKEDGTVKFENFDVEELLEGVLWNAPEES